MIEKSKIMFERLLREADGQPKEVWYSFKNEYYFRFALYREQYVQVNKVCHLKLLIVPSIYSI
jgi:hypothetical protein